MQALIITFGTEGDVRPMAALASALVGAGHGVRFLATADTAGAAEALSVPTVVIPGAVRDPLGAAGTTGNARSAAALIRVVNDNTAAWLDLALTHGADADIVVAAGLAAFVGFSAAEKLGVPGAGAAMFPITPTVAFASPFFPPGLPAWANALSHRLANGLVWQGFARATRAARHAVGLSNRRRDWSANPALYGFSPNLVPRPADWPVDAVICGLWTAPPPADWSPPADLAGFLAAGEPPIYVGFGSMALSDPAGLLAALTTAVAGRRTLFAPGWSGVARPDLPPNVHVVGPTPHDWLFPRCALAIHHGGSGTTHAAARAGIPQIIAPFAGDQPFWAERVQRLGVAPAPISVRRPDAGRIAAAIALAERQEVRDRAAALGRAMAAEDGLGAAVRQLEAWAGR